MSNLKAHPSVLSKSSTAGNGLVLTVKIIEWKPVDLGDSNTPGSHRAKLKPDSEF